jgi:hypothetical protein
VRPPRPGAGPAGRGSLLLGAALAALGCSVGQGTGYVRSDQLFVEECYRGPFDLRPTFFGANPFDDTLTIRVQRGEQEIAVSDGFTMLVYEVPTVRTALLNQRLPIGLPIGVSPLGYALPDVPNPPAATMSLYLNNSCRAQNASLSAVDGWVQFTKLFSGDPNEDNSEDRITDGFFYALVVDPNDAIPAVDEDGNATGTYTYPPDRQSEVFGAFNFVFHRGTPAQPFP